MSTAIKTFWNVAEVVMPWRLMQYIRAGHIPAVTAWVGFLMYAYSGIIWEVTNVLLAAVSQNVMILGLLSVGLGVGMEVGAAFLVYRKYRQAFSLTETLVLSYSLIIWIVHVPYRTLLFVSTVFGEPFSFADVDLTYTTLLVFNVFNVCYAALLAGVLVRTFAPSRVQN